MKFDDEKLYFIITLEIGFKSKVSMSRLHILFFWKSINMCFLGNSLREILNVLYRIETVELNRFYI